MAKCKQSVVLAAVFVLAAMLPFCCPYLYSDMPWLAKGTAYLGAFFLTVSVLALGCWNRVIGFIIFPAVAVVNFVSAYTFFVCKQYYNHVIFAKILETDAREAEPYLTLPNIAAVAVLLCVCIALPLVVRKSLGAKSLGILAAVSVPLSGLSAYASRHFVWGEPADEITMQDRISDSKAASFFPLYELYMTYVAIGRYNNGLKMYASLKNLPSGYVPPAVGRAGECPSDVVVVLMIGESVRADHLQINGYGRETTPNLAARTRRIVSYKKTCSFGLVTTTSCFGILTDAEVINRTASHKPWPDILTQDGVSAVYCGYPHMFDYYLGDDVQRYDLSTLAPDSYVYESSVELFRKALADHAGAGRLFMLCYDNGAHHPYRSLPQNARFSPSDSTLVGALDRLPELINAYDNTLLEVDRGVDGMIQCLEDMHRPAVFIYASDHGEALGEEGKLLHGVALPCVYNPALFIWCSKEFIEQYPESFEGLKANVGKTVSHDHLMHTVLSILGFRRGIYKKELDLTNKDANESSVPDSPQLFSELKTAR